MFHLCLFILMAFMFISLLEMEKEMKLDDFFFFFMLQPDWLFIKWGVESLPQNG